tara:strand:+ start:288 stop:809 length:522 start_codon:yes stop_codon:yes gene_type:complete
MRRRCHRDNVTDILAIVDGIEAMERAEASANTIALRSRAEAREISVGFGAEREVASIAILTQFLDLARSRDIPLRDAMEVARRPTSLPLHADYHASVRELLRRLPTGAASVAQGDAAVERIATQTSFFAPREDAVAQSEAELVAAYARQHEALVRVRGAMRTLADLRLKLNPY